MYGPRFGRLYLLPMHDASDARFRRLIGLRGVTRLNLIADPVERIVYDQSSGIGDGGGRASLFFCAAYRLMLGSRYVLPLRMAAKIVRTVAAHSTRDSAPARTVQEIGELVRAVESRLGIGDCYPRALLT